MSTQRKPTARTFRPPTQESATTKVVLAIFAIAVFLALFLFLRPRFFLMVVLLAVGANMPVILSEALGISRWTLVLVMGVMVGIAMPAAAQNSGPCFLRGTLIRTAVGYRAVETLAAGDTVPARVTALTTAPELRPYSALALAVMTGTTVAPPTVPTLPFTLGKVAEIEML